MYKLLYTLIQALVKNGNKLKIIKLIETILINLKSDYGCLNKFFNHIKINLYIRLTYFTKRIGGQNVIIPRIVPDKFICRYISKFILKAIYKRSEKQLIYRVQNELIDIYKNCGMSIQAKNKVYKLIGVNYTNIRFVDK